MNNLRPLEKYWDIPYQIIQFTALMDFILYLFIWLICHFLSVIINN